MKLNNLLDTKKKKIITGACAGILILGGIGIYDLSGNNGDLILTKNKITAGAMRTAKKPLRPLAFFILSRSFQTNRTI